MQFASLWSHHSLVLRTAVGVQGRYIMNQRQELVSQPETAKVGRLPGTDHKGRTRTKVGNWAEFNSTLQFSDVARFNWKGQTGASEECHQT